MWAGLGTAYRTMAKSQGTNIVLVAYREGEQCGYCFPLDKGQFWLSRDTHALSGGCQTSLQEFLLAIYAAHVRFMTSAPVGTMGFKFRVFGSLFSLLWYFPCSRCCQKQSDVS